jgi:hypothetical protein
VLAQQWNCTDMHADARICTHKQGWVGAGRQKTDGRKPETRNPRPDPTQSDSIRPNPTQSDPIRLNPGQSDWIRLERNRECTEGSRKDATARTPSLHDSYPLHPVHPVLPNPTQSDRIRPLPTSRSGLPPSAFRLLPSVLRPTLLFSNLFWPPGSGRVHG